MSFNFLFGDSIANPLLEHVLKINVRHSAKKLDPDKNGASAGGATPQSVYNSMVNWKNSSYYTPMKDSVVVLSTGWSNAGAYYKKGAASFETYGQWNYIEKQFKFLKDEGAKVFVIGIYSPPSSDDKYFSDGCTVVDASWFVNKGESKTSDVVKKRIFDEYQMANKWLFDKCNNYGFVFEQHSGGNTPLSNNNKGGYYYNGMSGDLHPSFVSHWNSMKQYVPEMTAEWTEWNKTGNKEVVKKEEGPTGSKWDLIFGDSIAAGIAKSALGLNRKAGGSEDPVSKDDKGASKVGANPDMILKYLKEFGEKNFDGKIVILSTGYSNGAHMKDIMKAQIKFLKDANAAVEIVGVSNTKEGGNDFLSNLASENGFKFSGGFEPAKDGTHPKNYNYVDLWNTSVSKNLPVAPTKVPEEQKTEEEKKVEKVPEKKSIFPILVSGSYKANSETELIGFQSYTSTDGSITKLGGMDDIVMAKLAEIYLMGYNPIPTKVDVTVDSDDTQPTGGTVNWTVEINESMVEKDKGNGKAWVGFTSRGVSGQKTDKDAKALFLTRTDLQATAVKTNLLAMDQLKPEGDNYVNYKDTKIEVEIVKDVLYENPANIKNNIKNAFRQTFYRYTLEDGWPSADKNADKKPTDEEKKATDNATEQQTSGNLSLTISRPTRKWQIPLEFETGHPANRDIPTFHIFIGDETNLEGMDEMTDFDYEEDYDNLDPEYLEANDSIVGSGGPMVDPTENWTSQKWEYEIGIMKEETAALAQSNPEVFGNSNESNNSVNSNVPFSDTLFNGNRIVLGGAMRNEFNDDEYVIKTFKSNVCDKFNIDYTRFLKQCDSYGIPRIIAMRQLAVECSFNEKVIRNERQSEAGAGGLCQFMPHTWQSYAKWDKTVFSNGVPQKGGYRGDPRVHLFGESTDGKIKNVDPPYFTFMSKLIKQFNGRLDLALAGYNSGPGKEIYKKALKNNLAFPSLPHGTKGGVPNESYKYATNILHKGSYWPDGKAT